LIFVLNVSVIILALERLLWHGYAKVSNYTFYEHESYPPFLSAFHQQEVLDLIHAFKFLSKLSTHKFV